MIITKNALCGLYSLEGYVHYCIARKMQLLKSHDRFSVGWREMKM
jgi:hypothetical protein